MSFKEGTTLSFNAVFIPPGWFHSPLLGEAREIAYPFWIADAEITGEQFSEFTKLQLRRNQGSQAAEYLSWNEALYYCFRADA